MKEINLQVSIAFQSILSIFKNILKFIILVTGNVLACQQEPYFKIHNESYYVREYDL
jgi:hypothetical protein